MLFQFMELKGLCLMLTGKNLIERQVSLSLLFMYGFRSRSYIIIDLNLTTQEVAGSMPVRFLAFTYVGLLPQFIDKENKILTNFGSCPDYASLAPSRVQCYITLQSHFLSTQFFILVP